MHSKQRVCIIPAILIGSALLYYARERMADNKETFRLEPMVIFPKGMEKKARTLMKEVRKAWDEIM